MFESVKCLFGSIFIDSLIYKFQILHELLPVPADRMFDRVMYLEHDAELNRGLWKDTCNGIRKAIESANTSDEDILNPSVLI